MNKMKISQILFIMMNDYQRLISQKIVDGSMCPFVGTVPKKAKSLNKLRPVERGSPFAVRQLAFSATSFCTLGAIVSLFQSVEKGNSHEKKRGSFL